MELHKTPLSHNFSEISFTCIFRCVTKQCTKSQIGCPQNAKHPKLDDLGVSSRGYACIAAKPSKPEGARMKLRRALARTSWNNRVL